MDSTFCKHYRGDLLDKPHMYCRSCDKAPIACDILWKCVRNLANSNDEKPVELKGTHAKLSLYRNNPNRRNPDIVYLQVNKDPWSLPKEDFLHFIATGYSKGGLKHQRDVLTTSPSLTQQEPWVNAIVEMLGGTNIPEIKAVIEVQKHDSAKSVLR